jgi:hypothetical protein
VELIDLHVKTTVSLVSVNEFQVHILQDRSRFNAVKVDRLLYLMIAENPRGHLDLKEYKFWPTSVLQTALKIGSLKRANSRTNSMPSCPYTVSSSTL